MKDVKKRIPAMLLSIVIYVSLLSVSALAEEKDDGTINAAAQGMIQAAERIEEPVSVISLTEDEPASNVVLSEEILLPEEEEEFSVVPTVEFGEENLLDAYAAQQLYAPLRGEKLRGQKNNGDKLPVHEHAVYTQLKQDIALVAAGDRTSTQFSYNAESFGFTQTTWTAEELGVESVIIDGALTAEAKSAVMAIAHIDLASVLNALMLDCPYELYWYDKTTGTKLGYVFSGSYGGSSPDTIILTRLTFKLSVASEYRDGGDQYTITSEFGEAIAGAVQRAGEIVSSVSGYADYEKLAAYKTQICDLVSYNHEAAADDDRPYGNPWQIIWVFDGDTGTNVVCEGYSKAFQYLCDRTVFDTKTIMAYCVSGTMDGGTGAGAHMWNLVTMEDGMNYLVDVTNCDDGTVGYPNELFMAGYSSGSVAKGYVFTAKSSAITYKYDKDTCNFYSNAELTVSQCSYLSHIYSGPSWSWAEDHSTASAAFTCSACGNVQTMAALVMSTTVGTTRTYTAAVTFKGITYTDEQTVEVEPSNITSSSVDFNGKLYLNTYIKLSDEVMADPDAYVRVTFNGETKDRLVTDLIQTYYDTQGRVKVRLEMFAAMLRDEMTLQVFNGAGEAQPLTYKETTDVTDGFVYTALEYLKGRQEQSTNPSMVELAKAAELYGTAVQVKFDYHTELLTAEDIAAMEAAANAITVPASCAETVTGTLPAGITKRTKTVMFESDNALRQYYYIDGGNIKNYTFTLNGETVKAKKLEAGKYYVQQPNIASALLSTQYTFSVSDGTDTYTIESNALGYAYDRQENSSDPTMVNLSKLLYRYSQAADAYFE